MIYKCVRCGKEFQASHKTSVCKDCHTGTCIICGKEFNLIHPYTQKTCSRECRGIYVKRSGIAKSRTVRAQQTVKEKYGTSRPPQNFKPKTCELCGKEFIPQSNRQVYCNGPHYGNCPVCGKQVEIREICRGSQVCSMECRQKLIAKTCIEKYGHSNYLLSSKINEFINFRTNPREYIESNYDTKTTLTQLSKDLGVYTATICAHINNNDCKDLINYRISTMKYEVIEFIKSLKDDINVVHNDRNVISPLEIDVYLPEFRFGIECNPSFTHNASISDPWGAEPKHYLYHKEKSDKCREAGVELFHIFGWEWEYKQDIIKSMIKNRLGLTDRRIYARNTNVVEVDFKTSVNSLNENHLQGMLSAPIRLGLVDSNNELVSLMTFGKMRSTIGQGQGNQYELSRFCNKLNTSVVGGASKLLKHYMKEYNTPLISFSDNAHTTGKLYENLNFKRDHDVAPRYTWVDPFTEYTINRLKTQKHNLRKLFNDDTIDIDNKTEKEIMLGHGYLQVYDAGLTKWVLDN